MDHFKFHVEFEYNGECYIGEVNHYDALSTEERVGHRIDESSYLIHLFSPKGIVSFDLYIPKDDEEMKWRTHAELSIAHEILTIIGRKIEEMFL